MLKKILAHGEVILSLVYFLFFWIDQVNSSMNSIANNLTRGLLLAMGITAALLGIVVIREERVWQRRLYNKKTEAAMQGWL